MIRGITFAEQLTTSADFAHFQNTFLDGVSGITKGCLVTNDNNHIYLSPGYFVVAGRFVTNVGIETIEVASLESGEQFCQLVFEVDLSQFNTVDEFNQGQFKILKDVTAYPPITQEDLDNGGTVYQMPFAKFKNTVNGITNFFDTTSVINVADIWVRLATENQAKKTQFETYWAAEQISFEEFFNEQKSTFLEFFDTEKTNILQMIQELQEQGFASEQDLNAHKNDYLSHTGYAATTGSANAYIATLSPALSAYAEGVSLRVKINVDNTGAATINVNGLGVKTIKKANGSDVNTGQLKANGVYTLSYNGSAFILQGEGSELSDAEMTSLINAVNGILKS